MDALVLIANPGSASRKYALYSGDKCRARINFEYEQGRVVGKLLVGDGIQDLNCSFDNVDQAASQLTAILQKYNLLNGQKLQSIALRVVAPTGYFLQDRLVDEQFVNRLCSVQQIAPLHVSASLTELEQLQSSFPGVQVVGVSDSAFHIDKPDYAWNYGLPLQDSDQFDLKRFGYHGLSVGAVVDVFQSVDQLPEKLVVCHLGSGASVTAVLNGQSYDTTMGYSPLEGLIMATRSGSLDLAAGLSLKKHLQFSDEQLEEYLNQKSGLLGLSGLSSDIRELLKAETSGDERSRLALSTYVHNVQKAIGAMTAAMGGINVLVFTGTVGERSVEVRSRIAKNLRYLRIAINSHDNQVVESKARVASIGSPGSLPVLVIATDEASQMLKKARAVLGVN